MVWKIISWTPLCLPLLMNGAGVLFASQWIQALVFELVIIAKLTGIMINVHGIIHQLYQKAPGTGGLNLSTGFLNLLFVFSAGARVAIADKYSRLVRR